MYKMLLPSLLAILLPTTLIKAQDYYWQQRVEYTMNIDVDKLRHQYDGVQSLRYFNNSPDTLFQVFYHLYFNAFQPGSAMDLRNRQLPDSDPRVKDRINKLKEHEMGWHRISSLSMDGTPCQFEVNETVLEVTLPRPIAPHSSVTFDMVFKAQIPIQIRRSGRDNKEGIAYSMTQWYPKICEYDEQGWHANPYIGREFYGVWGDFQVNITIDKSFVLGASGVLANGQEIGFGYEAQGTSVPHQTGEKLTWQWEAKNVHDFAWTADPDYTHTKIERADGLTLHFLYQENEKTKGNWELLPGIMSRVFDYANQHFGQYPYKSYAFLQGGDGGMEYPMATLITGERPLTSLVGVSVHELMHAWYYGVLGTNESLYAWMDEGFTEYASAEIENFLKIEKLLPGEREENPHLDAIKGLLNFHQSGREEPLSIHSDHFSTNAAYSVGAYVKGHVFLSQLEYILGKPVFEKAMLRYFNTWKFRHPTHNDFIRVMEKESNLELDWFKEYFVYTTKTIDYGIKNARRVNRKQTELSISNYGEMPMPLDIVVKLKGGKSIHYTIPLDIMRGCKRVGEPGNSPPQVLPDWKWVQTDYDILLDIRTKNIEEIRIDPSARLADINSANNQWIQGADQDGDEEND
jgi:hypothetical protein